MSEETDVMTLVSEARRWSEFEECSGAGSLIAPGPSFWKLHSLGRGVFFELYTMLHILVMMPDSGASISLSEKRFD